MSLLALGWFTFWHRGTLSLLHGDFNFLFLGDDNLRYFLLVRLQRSLVLSTLSMARRLIFLGLPFALSSLGGHTIVMRWTGYIRLRRFPAVTPQVLIHLEGCRLSRYCQPIKLTDIAHEALQQRRCEGWSYVLNPPCSEIQVVVQMEPVRHRGTRDLPEVNISSLHPSDSLPKGSCPMAGHACSNRSRWVSYAGRHQTKSPH